MPENHSTTRLTLTRDPTETTAHISPACAHHILGAPLCRSDGRQDQHTIPDTSTDTDTWTACPSCAEAAATTFYGFIPHGPERLLLAFGYPPAHRPFHKIRSILQALPPLDTDTSAAIGTMPGARDTTGLLHLDEWCARYPEATPTTVEVSLSPDGSADVGEPPHCRRGLPEPIEDALVAATNLIDDRTHLINLGHDSPLSLFCATQRIRAGEGPEADQGITARLTAHTPPPALPPEMHQDHELNRQIWQHVEAAVDPHWDQTQEIAIAASKTVAEWMLQDGSISDEYAAITSFSIDANGYSAVTFLPAHLRMTTSGRVLTLAESREIIDDVVNAMAHVDPKQLPLKLPAWVNDDIYDCVVTQDEAIDRYAQQIVAPCPGRIVIVADPALLPDGLWEGWPHRRIGSRQQMVACWVPAMVDLPDLAGEISIAVVDVTAASAWRRLQDLS